MSQIKFKQTLTAMGRNGISKCVGIDIFPTKRLNENNESVDIIVLTPINSTGQLTNGWIELEMDLVEELIGHLNFFKEYNDKGISKK